MKAMLDVSAEYMAKSVDCYHFAFTFTEYVKQDRPREDFWKPISLYKYSDKELCV